MNLPRLVVAGTQSGVGKTTVTTGLLGALKKRGMTVQAYKIGPDYLDPSYHTLITGRSSRNLDGWMLDEPTLLYLFQEASKDADISVIEGVMGLYDGVGGQAKLASTAAIAKLFQAPVILVVDAHGAATSVAAMVLGFKNLDAELRLGGVFLNRICSPRLLAMIKEALATYCPVPIVGYLEKNKLKKMPERHLGLVPAGEDQGLAPVLEEIVDMVALNTDWEQIMALAQAAPALPAHFQEPLGNISGQGLKIGLAFDEAFNFYYQDNLDLLTKMGVEIYKFSPLHDTHLPENIHGIIMGGGYPEVFLPQLAANQAILHGLRECGQKGLPIYAECGGYMYLSEGIYDFKGDFYPLTGLIPTSCRMEKKLSMLGYAEGTLRADCLLGAKGSVLKGHEFHYSRMSPVDELKYALALRYTRSSEQVLEGFSSDNLFASYLHLHFLGNMTAFRSLLRAWRRYQEGRKI